MSHTATGPRTEEGKARSSVNAVKHGLCSERPVIVGEDPAEWDTYREEIVRSLGPVTFVERELAERVALQMWRQRRAARYETELIAAVYDDEGADEAPNAQERARSLMKALDKIVRYESHIGRQLKEALNALYAAQAQRPPMPPAPPKSAPPEPRAAEPSSFRQTDAAARGIRLAQTVLPRPGVSFANIDLVPKDPAAKT